MAKREAEALKKELPLRGDSSLLRPLPWPANPQNDPPRALRALGRIIQEGLCHRCGSCVGICPTAALGFDKDSYPAVADLSACTDCDLCTRVCPGDEFGYQEHFQEVFQRPAEWTDTHGSFSDALIAYSNREGLREQGTSGGLITEILLHLYESGRIDGAVVIVSDERQLWRGKPIVARSKEEIIAAAKSKYAISPTNGAFSEISAVPGRYALVGLPCQIHGFRKAAALDRRLRERVVLTIGLFCHAAIEHDAFEVIWETLGDKTKGAKRFISRVGKHPGAPHLELADGTLYPVYFGWKHGYRPSSMEVINILYRLYTPPRCLTCFDGLSEFADISIGDPWIAPPDDTVSFRDGWSFALARTARGGEVLKEVWQAGKITVKELTRREALQCNKKMATEKRRRAFRVIETLRRQGKAVPVYGSHDLTFPQNTGIGFIAAELNMLTHICCFMPRLRRPLLRFALGNGGYLLLWLNHCRREVKLRLRDKYSSIMRRIRGRR